MSLGDILERVKGGVNEYLINCLDLGLENSDEKMKLVNNYFLY